MLNPKAKRRRLDDGASALSRPFKSPLRKDHTPTPTNRDKGGSAVPDPASSRVKAVVSNTTTPFQKAKARGLDQKYLQAPESESGPDAEPASLRRKRIALQSQLSSLRSDLETAQQALRIEASPRDDELKALIAKWRGVSQRAADELFEAARDKIERMGGVAAWKQSERERRQRVQMWEDEDFYAGLDGEECEGVKGAQSVAATTITRTGRKGEQKEAGDEEAFTIGMMLKSLNIEPETIGFDEVEERWVQS